MLLCSWLTGTLQPWCLVTCPQPAPMEGTDREILAGGAADFRGAQGHTLGWEGSLEGGIENHLPPAAGRDCLGPQQRHGDGDLQGDEQRFP